jgi:FkbM family methyltransferase
MRNLLSVSNVLKPEFIFRPAQLLRRLRWNRRWRGKSGTAMLPWGLPLEIDATEAIGMGISKIGVYDLIVPEAILRLCDLGETTLDIGANIGMNTGALALAAGPTGRVIAYEPHPVVIARLRESTAAWSRQYQLVNIEVRDQAVSSAAGTATLKVPRDFDNNNGRASLTEGHFRETVDIEEIEVPVATLDAAFPEDDQIGVLKIDIEGHELAALQGAERLLSAGCVRDIIFEEYAHFPTDISRSLENHGYTIFFLQKDILGPRLIATPCERSQTPPNYLATLDPTRALRRFKPSGYLSLREHPSLRS